MITNERHVINVKNERKQRRTGLRFRGLFLASFKHPHVHPHVHVPCGPPYRVVWLCSCTMVVFWNKKTTCKARTSLQLWYSTDRNIMNCLLNASIQFILIFCSTRHLKAKVEQIVNEKQEKTSQINNYGFMKKRTSFFFSFLFMNNESKLPK